MNRNTWNDRAVTFAEFSIADGDAVIEAFGQSGQAGSFALLVASLRYSDDNTPVFGSVEAIRALPFRHRERLAYLSGHCAWVNGLGTDPDALVAEDAQTNGHAEGAAAGPPH
jgi:hypothetical protein